MTTRSCPLCDSRSGKRYCPALAKRICAACCATKREIEIDCPSDCAYLRQGRSFEFERHDHHVDADLRRFDQRFLYRNAQALTMLAAGIAETRAQHPSIVDIDARAAFEALRATTKTLSSGIYYETKPEGRPIADALYRSLKRLLDEMMRPPDPSVTGLKDEDALEILEFMIATSDFYSGGRPKSRRHMDWLASMLPSRSDEEEGNRLIIP